MENPTLVLGKASSRFCEKTIFAKILSLLLVLTESWIFLDNGI